MSNVDTKHNAALTWSEQGSLSQHESIIEKGVRTFVDVGASLAAIRDQKLYRAEYGTFEAYCEKRWGLKRSRAYQLIEAAEVSENVQNFGQNASPSKESHMKPLASLPKEEQADAWEEAKSTAPGGKVTGKHVEEVVARRKGGNKQTTEDETTEVVDRSTGEVLEDAEIVKTTTTTTRPSNGRKECDIPDDMVVGSHYSCPTCGQEWPKGKKVHG